MLMIFFLPGLKTKMAVPYDDDLPFPIQETVPPEPVHPTVKGQKKIKKPTQETNQQ